MVVLLTSHVKFNRSVGAPNFNVSYRITTGSHNLVFLFHFKMRREETLSDKKVGNSTPGVSSSR